MLRGVVKDHRIPQDYNHAYSKSVLTSSFRNNAIKHMKHLWMRASHFSHPYFFLFFWSIPAWFLAVYVKTKTLGTVSQTMANNGRLWRRDQFYFQLNSNANPDNHFSSQFNKWSTDPKFGLDVGPKRPWLDLKDPTRNLLKFKKETLTNIDNIDNRIHAR